MSTSEARKQQRAREKERMTLAINAAENVRPSAVRRANTHAKVSETAKERESERDSGTCKNAREREGERTSSSLGAAIAAAYISRNYVSASSSLRVACVCACVYVRACYSSSQHFPAFSRSRRVRPLPRAASLPRVVAASSSSSSSCSSVSL